MYACGPACVISVAEESRYVLDCVAPVWHNMHSVIVHRVTEIHFKFKKEITVAKDRLAIKKKQAGRQKYEQEDREAVAKSTFFRCDLFSSTKLKAHYNGAQHWKQLNIKVKIEDDRDRGWLQWGGRVGEGWDEMRWDDTFLFNILAG